MGKDKLFKEISEETKEKARSCQTTEELLALAEDEGIDLSIEQLGVIGGGAPWTNGCGDYDDECPSFH